MTVKELKQICKDNNYTNYSKLTKQLLIIYIKNKGIATKGIKYKINQDRKYNNEYSKREYVKEYNKEYKNREYNKVWNYIRSMESWNITDKQKAEWSKGNYRASWGLWSETENNLLCINIDGDLFD
jgi:hypothetical protein